MRPFVNVKVNVVFNITLELHKGIIIILAFQSSPEGLHVAVIDTTTGSELHTLI